MPTFESIERHQSGDLAAAAAERLRLLGGAASYFDRVAHAAGLVEREIGAAAAGMTRVVGQAANGAAAEIDAVRARQGVMAAFDEGRGLSDAA